MRKNKEAVHKDNLGLDVKELKVGDKVWACAYEFTRSKDEKALFQKPVYGELTAAAKENYDIKYRDLGVTEPIYFVPYKKGSTDLSYSKAVRADNRKLAKTEEESKQIFNKLIVDWIKWHEECIKHLELEQL